MLFWAKFPNRSALAFDDETPKSLRSLLFKIRGLLCADETPSPEPNPFSHKRSPAFAEASAGTARLQ
jgi:hypothetical protein